MGLPTGNTDFTRISLHITLFFGLLEQQPFCKIQIICIIIIIIVYCGFTTPSVMVVCFLMVYFTVAELL